MPGIKRSRSVEDDGANGGAEIVHPSRKQRLEDGAADVELRKIFNDLRDEIQSTRLDATRNLLKKLSIQSDSQSQELDYSVTRLIKGICSSAKAARSGFSIALVEVLRLGFVADLKIVNVVNKIIALTNPEGNISGEEKRNLLIGRRLGFQSILQSNVLETASQDDAIYLFDAIADLATQKDWLRTECGAALHEFLISQNGSMLRDETVRSLIDSWANKSLVKSPEGVALWMTIKKIFPDVKLPKGHWHHNNPLSSQERPTLTKILLKNAVEADDESNGFPKKKSSGTRQITPSFVWQIILSHLYEEDSEKKFASFWDDCVAKAMFNFTSSTERKSLGLQIFTKALGNAPTALLGQVVHENIIQCIVDQRAKPDRFLYEAAKTPLTHMVKRAESEPAAASVILCKLLNLLPSNFDKLMKTTLESVLSAVDDDGLGDVVATAVDLCRIPGMKDSAEAEKKRRVFADVLLSAVRSRRSQPSLFFADDGNISDWLGTLLRSLAHLGYTTPSENAAPTISESSRNVFQERLMSVLGHLVNLPLHQAAAAPSLVVETLHESRKAFANELSEQAAAALKEARKHLKDATKKAKTVDGSAATVIRAFQLLLALGMLQVYKQEPDSVGVLEDISACYQSPRDDSDASTMIVELLLSFVSKPSALFRKLAEQVFSAFAPEVTAEGLQSMVDILSQKESLAGQQELFAQDEEEDDAEDSIDEDAMDVEDASDMELTNGEIADNTSSDSSSAASEDDSDSDSTSEEAAFDLKLATALQTTTNPSATSSDSDMDDDQMLALEPHLTTIFLERAKSVPKKSQQATAKTTITNFKNRVLDLLSIYLRSQSSNPLALNTLHPLLALTRTTSNPPTAKKATNVLESYFDTCRKHKTFPAVERDSGFEILAAVVEGEMRAGGSKMHASACSRAAQFLAKMLVGREEGAWREIAGMFVGLQEEWRREGARSKIQGSVFNEWHSWSMQR